MLIVRKTKSFQKDIKLAKKRNLNLKELDTVVHSLAREEKLDQKYKDHPLGGDYLGFRECHIKPDWLLIYRIDKKMIVTIDFIGHKVKYESGEFDKFTLAYAISIHKSQGSEYDNVVIVLARSFKRMFYNKLIYTAVTRAKSSLIILGSIDSFNSSFQTLYADNRNTYLKNV